MYNICSLYGLSELQDVPWLPQTLDRVWLVCLLIGRLKLLVGRLVIEINVDVVDRESPVVSSKQVEQRQPFEARRGWAKKAIRFTSLELPSDGWADDGDK